MKKLLISAILLFSVQTMFAQNDMQISNFMFNTLAFNPASAGNTEYSKVSLLHRQQWMGFNTAPSSQLLNADMFFEGVGGVGLSVINDKLGHENSQTVRAMYSARINLSENAVLAGGAGLGILNKSLDKDALTIEDPDDPTFSALSQNELKPDFSFGLEFVLKEKMRLGLSTTHLLKSLKNSTTFEVPRHYYFFASYNIPASETIIITPSLLFKSSKFIHQAELNCNAKFNNRFWFGFSYRYNTSAVGLLGVKITDFLQLAYSYDFDMGKQLKSYSNGTHEIMLVGMFAKKSREFNPSM
ncbi:MAG: type IX secretion system membrane protein PorP/SprF [Bacteroidota bacterium]